MEQTTFWEQWFPMLTGVFVVPLVQWLKQKIPWDVPVLSLVMSAVLNVLLVLGVRWVFKLDIDLTTGMPLILGIGTSAAVHAGYKTVKKLPIMGNIEEN